MTSDLWSFALGLYSQPEIEKTLLRAQDQGADICLLLCAAWLEQRGCACSESRANGLRSLAHARQDAVIRPLRRLRQQWKAAAAQDSQLAVLREGIKALELQAERQLLQQLATYCHNWQPVSDLPSASWLAALGQPLAIDHEALVALRRAVVTQA
jgi:uncharacterized protein (TIGR02444 family)